MQESNVIGWVGVGLISLVNLGGMAFFWGRLAEEVKGLRRDHTEHVDQKMPQAHECPYFTPERH